MLIDPGSKLVIFDGFGLRLELDPTDVDERLGAVSFNIGLFWDSPNGSCELRAMEHWFDYLSLNQFEMQLAQWSPDPTSVAILRDMSKQAILTILWQDQELVAVFRIGNTGYTDEVVFTSRRDPSEMELALSRWRAFPKWW